MGAIGTQEHRMHLPRQITVRGVGTATGQQTTVFQPAAEVGKVQAVVIVFGVRRGVGCCSRGHVGQIRIQVKTQKKQGGRIAERFVRPTQTPSKPDSLAAMSSGRSTGVMWRAPLNTVSVDPAIP